jgi:uncharacterized protein (DUF1697 family)
MADHAAFLRAINVGGHRVSNAELGSAFEQIGFGDVTVFRASGNVVFDADGESANALAPRIEKALEEQLGYAVPVYLRSATEVRAIAQNQAFDDEIVAASKGKLQIALLSARPAESVRARVLELATGADRLAFGDRELLWLPSGGTLDSDLDLKAIDRLLGPSTMRTKGTIERIAAKHFG